MEQSHEYKVSIEWHGGCRRTRDCRPCLGAIQSERRKRDGNAWSEPGVGGILSPYSGGGYSLPATTLPPASPADMLPAHQVVKHAKVMHAHHRAMAEEATLTGNTAAQLNREELARIQSYDPPAPPPAELILAAPMLPQPNPSGGNSMGMPGPNPGGPNLTPYTD